MINKVFMPFPVLHTNRLTLRQLVINDDKKILALRSDNNVNKYINRQPGKTISDARIFIENITKNVANNNSIYWAITMKSIDELIGTICLFDFSDEHDKAEMGYELLPDFQGKGLMQEAASKVIEFGFRKMNLNVIEAYTHNENQSSAKLLEKFNFVKQPTLDTSPDKNFTIFKLLNIEKLKGYN